MVRASRITEGTENEQGLERSLKMQRGVSQLLFNYLPYRTVDWEDGLAVVQLGNVRLSSVWDEERKTTLLREIGEAFSRWKARGGRIDPAFPDPLSEPERFAVGAPFEIDAAVMPAALICQKCGQIMFEKGRTRSSSIQCTNPACSSQRVHQIPFVFVHGCGELVPITEWMPATKSDESSGALTPTRHPIRCDQCQSGDHLYIPGRSERVKDMKVLCRKCNILVRERFTCRCHRCLRRLTREPASAPHEKSGSIVSALAMRLARYSASDTYYPQTLSVLRLDRPQMRTVDDQVSSVLFRMLPPDHRPDASVPTSDSIKALLERLKAAEAAGDLDEQNRLQTRIADIAQGKVTAPTSSEKGLLQNVSPDTEKAIKESLAFRNTVTTVPAEQKMHVDDGTSNVLLPEIQRLKSRLGLDEVLYVDDLPVITATYGFTRRSFEPTYEELGARNLPVEIRSFPALQRFAIQALARPDLMGTIPILAREGEHEGIFLSLKPDLVIRWLQANGISLGNAHLPDMARIMSALEPADHDRYLDTVWTMPVRRLVFGLIHSLSHAAMRAITRYAGIDRTSVAEYIFLPLIGFVVYDNSSSFKLGGIATLVRDHLAAFLQNIGDEAIECLYDPDCSDHSGACHGCLHSPEISCRTFNHGLSRALLLGGHTPWADVSVDSRVAGYWEVVDRNA